MLTITCSTRTDNSKPRTGPIRNTLFHVGHRGPAWHRTNQGSFVVNHCEGGRSRRKEQRRLSRELEWPTYRQTGRCGEKRRVTGQNGAGKRVAVQSIRRRGWTQEGGSPCKYLLHKSGWQNGRPPGALDIPLRSSYIASSLPPVARNFSSRWCPAGNSFQNRREACFTMVTRREYRLAIVSSSRKPRRACLRWQRRKKKKKKKKKRNTHSFTKEGKYTPRERKRERERERDRGESDTGEFGIPEANRRHCLLLSIYWSFTGSITNSAGVICHWERSRGCASKYRVLGSTS